MDPLQLAKDLALGASNALKEKPAAPETVHVAVRADQLLAVCQLAQSAAAPVAK